MEIKEAVAIIDRLGIGSRGYRNLEEAVKTVVEFARTQPVIIRCGECVKYDGMGFCGKHGIWIHNDDFCSMAEPERRTDGA